MEPIKFDFVEDLLTAQMVKGNAACIKFFLDRRHPLYKLRRSDNGGVLKKGRKYLKMRSLETDIDDFFKNESV